MAKRGLVIMLPMRVRETYPDVADEVIELPELTLPPIVSGEGGTTVPPSPPTVPPVVSPPYDFQVIDAIERMPRAPENTDYRGSAPKTSLTYHWEGPDVLPMMNDAETIAWLIGVARGHITKDYGGGQRGSGIMYHEAIAQSGNSILTRNFTEILWHANNDTANLSSRAILVVCSRATAMTAAQRAAIAKRYEDFSINAGRRLPAYPHSTFTNTDCPGDAIRAIVSSLR